MEDWTWKERRMRWKLKEIARKEMSEGRKVWIGYGKIRIGERWWKWDKEEELNTEKTNIIKFRRGGGREKKKEWRWKGRKIEEVKEIKYLGYVLQKNGGQEAQIRERAKKAAAIMGQVWGIGKRRFGRDWGRRLWLFDRLVWTVME